MKALISFLCVLGLCVLGVVLLAEAQDTRVLPPSVTGSSPDMDVVRFVLTQGRRRTFENTMKLSPREGQIFWKVYADYEEERGRLEQQTVTLLDGYLKRLSSFTSEQAIQFTNELAEHQQAGIVLRTKYFKILSEQLNGVIAARFYQVDDYVTAAIKLDFLENVPFIGETRNK